MTVSGFESDTKRGQGQGHVKAGAASKEKLEIGLADLSSYTVAALKDELTYQLSAKIEIDWTTLERKHKYHDRAALVLSQINIFHPTRPPIFIINTSDISKPLQNALDQLKRIDPRRFDELVTAAIETLFEGTNERYYHVSGIHNKVKWRFDP